MTDVLVKQFHQEKRREYLNITALLKSDDVHSTKQTPLPPLDDDMSPLFYYY